MKHALKSAANQALARGEIEEALRLWSQVTSGHATPDDLLEHGILLQSLYRSSEAQPIWERLLEHRDATPEQWLAAGRQWFQLGRFAGCARFTAKAWEAQADSPVTAELHAAALERANDLEGARCVAAAGLKHHPHHARLIRMMAHIERREGRFDRAREQLEVQLRHHASDDDWRLRYELATVLDRLGEYAGAMHELELAKRQLAPTAAKHRSQWRAMSGRQWEVTQGLTPERLARWKATAPPCAQKICLMAGFPRSGTTLLENVLASHPGCIGTDESGILASQFRDPLIFGASSASAALEELDAFEAGDLEAGRNEYLRCTADVLGEDPGDRVLLEKDPLLTADFALPLRLFPDAKILMPLRDPRDVVMSFYFTLVPLAPNSVASATLEEPCLFYADVMRHWLWLRERLDASCWMESRYEDLLADPELQTRRLASFLGIDWRAEMLSHHKRSDGRAVGTPTYDDVSKPLYTRALGRWRNYERWLEPHLAHLTPLLDAFGYR